MVNKVGIIQGRLTPSGGKLQCFPDTRWKEEFALAAKVGFDYIELISDATINQANPLWSGNELDILKVRINDVPAGVVSMTVDHIMHTPLTTRDEHAERSYNQLVMICERAASVGVLTIVLPFLEGATLTKNKDDLPEAARVLKQLILATNRKLIF
jgi:L-ribulose-5-phosphate 3-epimerase UlaE